MEVKLNQFSSSQQQALVGEDSREDQFFLSGRGFIRDGFSCELDGYLQNLKVMILFPFYPSKEILAMADLVQ